jgi:HNH endonuclease
MKPFCSFTGCNKAVYGRQDICYAHYMQKRRTVGKLKPLRTSRYDSLETRIAKWKTLSTVNEDGCWIWQAASTSGGYGQASVNGHRQVVHKLVWEFYNGPVPDGLELDHLCRQRHCWNPEHLEAVTHKVNGERGFYGTKTHCPKGHPYSGRQSFLHVQRRTCLCSVS